MNRRTFIGLAIPLGLAGIAVAEEANAKNEAGEKKGRLSGVVKSVDKGKSTIEVRGRKDANMVRKLMYDSSTKFTLDGKPATADDVKDDLSIVATGKWDGVNLKADNVTLRQR